MTTASANSRALQANEFLVPADRTSELALYDDLPPQFRRLLDEAPVNQQVAQVLEIVEVWGWNEAYGKICDYWEQVYPGWKRPRC